MNRKAVTIPSAPACCADTVHAPAIAASNRAPSSTSDNQGAASGSIIDQFPLTVQRFPRTSSACSSRSSTSSADTLSPSDTLSRRLALPCTTSMVMFTQ